MKSTDDSEAFNHIDGAKTWSAANQRAGNANQCQKKLDEEADTQGSRSIFDRKREPVFGKQYEIRHACETDGGGPEEYPL